MGAPGGTVRITELRTLAERGECRIRIILPNPNNQTVIEELAGRFNTKPETLKEKIKEAVEEFTSIFGEDSKVTFELYYINRVPLFTYYRFDDLCIASFYNHQRTTSRFRSSSLQGPELLRFFP